MLRIGGAMLAGSLFLSGCSVVGSKPFGSSGQQAQIDETGVLYMLPKAMLEFVLKEKGGRFTLDVGQPEYIGDPKRSYILHYKPSPFAKDILTVEVNPNGLLTTVNVKAEDKLDDTLVNLAKSVAVFLEAAEAVEGEVVLLRQKIDPANDLEVEGLRRDIATVIVDHVKRKRKQVCPGKDATSVVACGAYAEMADRATPIEIEITKPGPVAGGAVDCSVGVCYRSKLPYTISIGFTGATEFSTVVALPNEAPAVALSVDRAMFVTRDTQIALENGMLKKVFIEKESEAVDAAILPFNIAKAPLEAIKEVLPLKLEIQSKEVEMIKKDLELIKLKKELAEAQATREESALEDQQQRSLLSASNEVPLPPSPALRDTGPAGRGTDGTGTSNPGSPNISGGLPEDPTRP